MRTFAQARKTIEVEPQPGAALALAEAEQGRPAEALQSAEQAAKVTDSPGVMAVAASALARAGEKNKARLLMERSLQLAQKTYVCRFLVAAAYVDLGEKEKPCSLWSAATARDRVDCHGSGWIPE